MLYALSAFSLNQDSGVSWTPSLSLITIGDGSLSGRKMQVGNLMTFGFSLTFGSTTTVDGAWSSATLPATAASIPANGFVEMSFYRAGLGDYRGNVLIGSGQTAFNFLVLSVSGTTIGTSTITSSYPMTFTTGDVISCTGQYRVG